MTCHLAIVIPVRRGAEASVLKLSWQDAGTRNEPLALKLWNGRGMVRLLESDAGSGAMLLERLDGSRTLFDLPIDETTPILGEMIRRLAVPGDASLPSTNSLASDLVRTIPERWQRLGQLFPRRTVDRAVARAESLLQSANTTLVNWDLHYGNILRAPARAEWVAIDPKPAMGDPESAVAQLLWTRISDFSAPGHLNRWLDALSDAAGLDPHLTREWSVLRAVDFWLWALGVGLTDDPGGCETIVDWLV